MDQERKLSDVLSEFARTMLTDFPIQAILDHLVVRIVDVLPITGAGVTLVSWEKGPSRVAASDATALLFENLQAELGDGPCVLAYESGEAVAVPDLRTETRFRRFGAGAIDAGLAGVFTFPLRHGDAQLGALDLYRTTPGSLDDEAMTAAQTLADVVSAYLINAQARADLRDSADRYRESALHDPLTGLPNRTLFAQQIEHAVLRARRSGQLVALLFVDLDRFKSVNDLHGHHVGDELLIAAAGRLSATMRTGDTLARLSGDEFVMLCEDLGSPSQIEPVIGRLSAALSEPFELGDKVLRMTASIGVAVAAAGDDVPERLLVDADSAMYEAKRDGGDRHRVIDLRERGRFARPISLERDLRGAAIRGELCLEYQPIVATGDGRTVGVEALMRWIHPDMGLLLPSTILPVARRARGLPALGRWVLETAARDHGGWGDQRAGRPGLWVNISAEELLAPDFADAVAEGLAAIGTDPSTLTLEVGESVFLDDAERAIVVLEALRRAGVRLALDDFGTGYSALRYLRRFTFDVVKVDRVFLADIATCKASVTIFEGIVSLAHGLGMAVVAGGVESAEQYVLACGLGCEFAQGHHLAAPMPAADVGSLAGSFLPATRPVPAGPGSTGGGR